MKKNGFTLAEVLIVLIILGVVAAMTIPSLMGNANQTAFITGFQKGYSNLLHAFSVSSLEVGLPLRSTTASDLATKGFAPYFKTMATFIGDEAAGFQSQDGIAYIFKEAPNKAKCKVAGSDLKNYEASEETGEGATGSACFYVVIDVNGKKGPNILTTSNVRSEAQDRYLVFLHTDTVTTGPYATAAIMANTFAADSNDSKNYASFSTNPMFTYQSTDGGGAKFNAFNEDTTTIDDWVDGAMGLSKTSGTGT